MRLFQLGLAFPAIVTAEQRGSFQQKRHAAFLAEDRQHVEQHARSLAERGIVMTLHDAQPLEKTAKTHDAPRSIPLSAVNGISRSLEFTSLIANTSSAPITGFHSQVFMVPLTVGSQKLQTVIDTGSSDTWLAASGFACRPPGPNWPKDCAFGPAFEPGKSSTFKNSSSRFSTQYGAERLSGFNAVDKVELAGLQVPNQEIAVVTSGFWRGDGKSSGLLGLGFPDGSAKASLFPGVKNNISPVFTSLVKSGKVKPIFSLVVPKGDATGSITLGGLPDEASAKTNGKWAKSPMQYISFERNPPEPVAGKGDAKPRAGEDYRVYRFTVSGFNVPGANVGGRRVQVSVDTGTAHNILPNDVAKAINSKWQPPAKQDRGLGTVVDCNAKNEGFGIKIGDVEIKMAPSEMIIPSEKPGVIPCMSAVQEMGSFPGGGMLGNSFLKGVVATFDIGAAELRFAQRT